MTTHITFYDRIQPLNYSFFGGVEYLASFGGRRFCCLKVDQRPIFKIIEAGQRRTYEAIAQIIIQLVLFPLTIIAIVIKAIYRAHYSFVDTHESLVNRVHDSLEVSSHSSMPSEVSTNLVLASGHSINAALSSSKNKVKPGQRVSHQELKKYFQFYNQYIFRVYRLSCSVETILNLKSEADYKDMIRQLASKDKVHLHLRTSSFGSKSSFDQLDQLIRNYILSPNHYLETAVINLDLSGQNYKLQRLWFKFLLSFANKSQSGASNNKSGISIYASLKMSKKSVIKLTAPHFLMKKVIVPYFSSSQFKFENLIPFFKKMGMVVTLPRMYKETSTEVRPHLSLPLGDSTDLIPANNHCQNAASISNENKIKRDQLMIHQALEKYFEYFLKRSFMLYRISSSVEKILNLKFEADFNKKIDKIVNEGKANHRSQANRFRLASSLEQLNRSANEYNRGPDRNLETKVSNLDLRNKTYGSNRLQPKFLSSLFSKKHFAVVINTSESSTDVSSKMGRESLVQSTSSPFLMKKVIIPNFFSFQFKQKNLIPLSAERKGADIPLRISKEKLVHSASKKNKNPEQAKLSTLFNTYHNLHNKEIGLMGSRARWENPIYELYRKRLGGEFHEDPWSSFVQRLQAIRERNSEDRIAQEMSHLLYTTPLLGYAWTLFEQNLKVVQEKSLPSLKTQISNDLNTIDSIESQDKKSPLIIQSNRFASIYPCFNNWDPVGVVGNIPFAIGELNLNNKKCIILRLPSPIIQTSAQAESSGEFNAFINHLQSSKKRLVYICLLNEQNENHFIKVIRKVSEKIPSALTFIRMPMNGKLMHPNVSDEFSCYIESIKQSILNNQNGFEFSYEARDVAQKHVDTILKFILSSSGLGLQALEEQAALDQNPHRQEEIRQTILLSICIVLKHILLEHLQADYCNSSCKDAIDRGGVHLSCDLMWQALLSGQLADPTTRHFIRIATHFPAFFAKSWAINSEHRKKLINFAEHVIDQKFAKRGYEELVSFYNQLFNFSHSHLQFYEGNELDTAMLGSIYELANHDLNKIKASGAVRGNQDLSRLQYHQSLQFALDVLEKNKLICTFQADLYHEKSYQKNVAQAENDFSRRQVNWNNEEKISVKNLLNKLEDLNFDAKGKALFLQCCSQTVLASVSEMIINKMKAVGGRFCQGSSDAEFNYVTIEYASADPGGLPILHIKQYFDAKVNLQEDEDPNPEDGLRFLVQATIIFDLEQLQSNFNQLPYSSVIIEAQISPHLGDSIELV